MRYVWAEVPEFSAEALGAAVAARREDSDFLPHPGGEGWDYLEGRNSTLHPAIRPMHAARFPWSDQEIADRTANAVAEYWGIRTGQAQKQKRVGRVTDYGTRSEVTGGKHLAAFTQLFCELIAEAGFGRDEVRFKTGVELPGYYRPTKQWDVVVIRNGRLCAAIELKSQVGPSFGKNFNNRTEEALGNSLDLWTAFREGFVGLNRPWLGYFFFLEDADGSTRSVSVSRTSFKADPVFAGTSYADRYGILCRRLVLERNYDAATLILAPKDEGGQYRELAHDLGMGHFLKGLYGHLIGCS